MKNLKGTRIVAGMPADEDQTAPLNTSKKTPSNFFTSSASQDFMAHPSAFLRNSQDRRTLLWAFGLFPLPLALAARWPTATLWLLPLSVYVGFSAGVLSHNHNHRGIFKSARLNRLYSHWLTFFYGFPLWAWIPTHNQNHHKYLNGPGDETSTAKSSVPDGLWAAISFPTRSSAWQLPTLSRYFKAQRAKGALLSVLTPVLILPLGAIALSLLLLSAHPPQTALLILGIGWLVPILTASWSMMFLNYLQHIGCDPASPTRHSRDFVGRWENWLVFNAGLHTVHHEHPGAHWSEYPRLHLARASALDPALMEQNVPTFIWRRYLSPRRQLLSRTARSSEPVAPRASGLITSHGRIWLGDSLPPISSKPHSPR